MGRRTKHGRGVPLDLGSIGVFFGRKQEEVNKERKDAELEATRAAIDELRSKLDDAEFTEEADKVAPADLQRRKRIAELATGLLRLYSPSTIEKAEAFVLQAIEEERREYTLNIIWDFEHALRKSYDLVSIGDIYDLLAGAGLVTESRVEWWGTYDFLVHPTPATSVVRDFFIQELSKVLPEERSKSRVDFLLAVSKACKGRSIDINDETRDILEQHLNFSTQYLYTKFTDPGGAGLDSADGLISSYGPLSISRRSSTRHTVVLSVTLPRGIAVEIIKRYVAVIQPFVRQHNAQKQPKFDLRTASKFTMAAQAVPHFLGRKCDENRHSNKYELITALNVGKSERDRDVRRSDIHVNILPGNAQCVGAAHFNVPLNKHQTKYIEAAIKHAGGNDEDSYWSNDDL